MMDVRQRMEEFLRNRGSEEGGKWGIPRFVKPSSEFEVKYQVFKHPMKHDTNINTPIAKLKIGQTP